LRKVKRIRRIRNWSATALFLLACISPSFVVPGSTEAVKTHVPGILGTMVAQTAAVAQTQTALSLPTSTYTSIPTGTLFPTRKVLTPTSTPTYIYAFPTFTKLTATPTQATPTLPTILIPVASKDNVTNTLTVDDANATRFPKIPKEWNCTVMGKTPPQGTSVDPKEKFYVSWTIKNTGTRAWTSNTIDFVYTGGFRSDERPIQDLRSTVAPGGSITVKVQLTASKFPGTYNTFWSLRVGNTKFCHMKQTFEVK